MNSGCIIFLNLVSLLNCAFITCWAGLLYLQSQGNSRKVRHYIIHARLHHLASGGKGWEHQVFLIKYIEKKSPTPPLISEAFNPSYSCVFGAVLQC